MSDQDDLFKQTPNPQEPNGDPVTPSDDPYADLLGGIKNEQGEPKYKSTQQALEALKASQDFIPKVLDEKKEVERRMQELEAELAKRKSVEEAVKELTGNKQQPPAQAPTEAKKEEVFDPNKVENMLEQMLEKRTQAEREKANLDTVQKSLLEAYGDKAKSVVQEKSKELDMTPAELETLAKKNPRLVLSLVGNVQMVSNAPSTSQVVPNRNAQDKLELKPNEKKILTSGVSNKDLMDSWAQARDYTHKKLGVTQ